MKNLENHVELIQNAKTIEEAFASFCSVMSEYGYDRVAYSLVTDHHSLGLPRQHGLATSYPEDWMAYYNEKNYLKDDAVVLAVLKSRTPFFWDDLKTDPDIPAKSLEIMRQGGEAGVKDGIGIPLFGHAGEVVGLGLARKENEKGRDYQFLAGAYLLATFFHEKYRGLIIEQKVSKVTDREKDILGWGAEGKTDEEIAIILNMSVHTVRWHWKKIFRKLEAHGRLYAITKAIATGLVTPHYIAPPH